MTAALVCNSPAAAYFTQKGIAMSPTIREGEQVPVDPRITSFVGAGIYLTAWADFQSTPICPLQVPALRRLGYVDGVLHSISDNMIFPPFPVSLDSLLIGGKVIAAMEASA